jgi:uncharacterized MAPEG superfamily protein
LHRDSFSEIKERNYNEYKINSQEYCGTLIRFNMNFSLWCILIAGFLPYICAGIAKWGFNGYDNNNPRAWLSQQTGFRARANAAQQNSFESFPLFAAMVLMAHQLHADAHWVNILAGVFVLARMAYIYCYVKDQASLRSICWAVGIVCVVAIFALSVQTV